MISKDTDNASVGAYVVIFLALTLTIFWWIINGAMFDILNDVTQAQTATQTFMSADRLDTINWINVGFKVVPFIFLLFMLVYGIFIALRERAEGL